MAIKQTRKEVEKIVKDGINSDAALITNNKSVLYNKSFEDLQSFQWADVVGKMVVCQPTLANILLTVMSRNRDRQSLRKLGAKTWTDLQHINAGTVP